MSNTKHLKKLPSGLVQVLLLIAVVTGVSHWQTRHMLLADGSAQIAPMQLVSLEGQIVSMTAEGKRTLVYFWAPWCSVCALSIASLRAIDNDKLHLVTVAMDYNSIEAVQAFVDKHHIQSSVLLGTAQLKKTFQIQGYPSYYLLDEKGRVVARSFGLNTSLGIKLKDWLSRL